MEFTLALILGPGTRQHVRKGWVKIYRVLHSQLNLWLPDSKVLLLTCCGCSFTSLGRRLL